MDTHACICCPLLLNLVKTLTPENIKRLNGKVKKGFFLFLSLKSSNFSFLPWPFPQSVSNNYTPTPPPHLPPLCFGFPSWRFSSVPSFLGLSKQTVEPGSGLTLRTLLRSPLPLDWHDNRNHGPQKETHKGRQAFNAGAICQFSLGSFQELKEAKAGAEKEGLQGRAEKKSFTGKAIAI